MPLIYKNRNAKILVYPWTNDTPDGYLAVGATSLLTLNLEMGMGGEGNLGINNVQLVPEANLEMGMGGEGLLDINNAQFI